MKFTKTDSDGEVTGFYWGKIGLMIGVIFIAVGLLGAACDIIGGYGNEAKRVVGVDNVKEQTDAIITDWESLIATADNACEAQTQASNPDNPTLVEDPAFAYKATYRKIVVEYNQRQKNLFKAKVVGPPGYPKSVPDLDTVGPQADWCQVSADLQSVHG